jgi:Prolipoprotein diacylglyceryl transferase
MAGDIVPATSVSAGRRRIHLSSSGFGYAGTVARARSAASSPRRTSAWRLVMGVLYEVLLGAAIFALVWPMRHRLRRPGDLAWLVLGLFAAGRFFEFFVRSDSPNLALGLNNAQWTSVALLGAVALGWTLTARRAPHGRRPSARAKGETNRAAIPGQPRPDKLSGAGREASPRLGTIPWQIARLPPRRAPATRRCQHPRR